MKDTKDYIFEYVRWNDRKIVLSDIFERIGEDEYHLLNIGDEIIVGLHKEDDYVRDGRIGNDPNIMSAKIEKLPNDNVHIRIVTDGFGGSMWPKAVYRLKNLER